MNPKQSRLLVLALLVSATAIITWRSLRTEAPITRATANVKAHRTVAADIKPAEIKTDSAPAAALNPPERTIQFIDKPELAPGWVIKYGQEFWRYPTPNENLTERENHALIANETTGGAEVDAGNYAARVDRD